MEAKFRLRTKDRLIRRLMKLALAKIYLRLTQLVRGRLLMAVLQGIPKSVVK